MAGSWSTYTLTNQQVGADENTNLIFHFNAGSGVKIWDSSGHNSSGTIAEGIAWTDGLWDKCIDCDGSSTNLIVRDNPYLDGMSELTIISWFKSNRAFNDNSETIVAKDEGENDRSFAVMNWRGYPYAFIFNDTTYAYIGSPATPPSANLFCDGKWHQFSITWKSNDYLRGYVDGKLFDTSASTLSGVIHNSNIFLSVGMKNITTDNWFYGKIEEISIYIRQFSAGEIYHNYTRQSGGNQ